MATVADILTFLNTIAPPYMAESWDRIGLNCGHLRAPVTRILVALDPFLEACLEAKTRGANLLVTHHALLWTPGFVTDADAQGRNALFLIENGIAHINAHTNLDNAPGGVNDCLAARLGLTNVRVISPKGCDAQGRPWGLLRQGETSEIPLAAFLESVKRALNCPGLRYIDAKKAVHRVAVGGGACADGLHEVLAAGCDTFVTADVKYNSFRDAHDIGINLIDAGHYWTEAPVCAFLAKRLREAFPEIAVDISEAQRDCMKFYSRKS